MINGPNLANPFLLELVVWGLYMLSFGLSLGGPDTGKTQVVRPGPLAL
eukprot:CAMPEP_0119113260 /NCGR_PEP_ID=MMETSP1180-20130426/43347_1 /TAXON_ID=3052 ORGANISM="Chlamydomonas cf sp, Strain CCMP681" /NCGR_SAMPLE_ID=MMETSP1180 /ASSEMBLY_ACC=CAM_ASM_000741 /LENGTH=47 /DNA_ID= /DNA_START= /DNA_END= /DNA_ORIENTATION=